MRRSSRGLCNAVFRHSCLKNEENKLKLQPGLAVSRARFETAASRMRCRHITALPLILVTKPSQIIIQPDLELQKSFKSDLYIPKDRSLTDKFAGCSEHLALKIPLERPTQIFTSINKPVCLLVM